MSLLLDALKKAAEQKAEKARSEGQDVARSDETIIDAAPEDISGLESSDDSDLQIRPPGSDDETELDHSDYDTRLQRVKEQRDPGDETGIEVADETAAQAEALSAQMQTGEDETIIFADEDVSDFMGEEQYVSREPGDETDLSQLAERTDASRAAEPRPPAGDDTNLSQVAYVDESDDSKIRYTAPGDDTDLSRVEIPEQADPGRAEASAEDTDLSRVEMPADTTDHSRVEMPPETTDHAAAEPEPEEDPSIVMQGEDMSLLLRDDTTGMTSHTTSVTDPQADQASILSGDAEANLDLVDVTRPQAPRPDETSTVSSTATTGVALDTLTSEGTTTRTDSTSTRTYAPDNYDRTLMKLPGEDASKLFAGMKSDADVVMTPDYAKKVFQSKSSASRRHHALVYGGIAGVILAALVVFGFNEMIVESDNIDASLRPLMRDPMPGIIKPAEEEQQGLFGESEIDAKTIELVQSAENEGAITEEMMEETAAGLEPGEVAETETPAEIEALLEDGSETVSGTIAADSTTSQSSATAAELAQGIETASVEQSSVPTSGVIASDTEETSTVDDNPNLHIVSTQQLEEKHKLLREAYEAYKTGNDKLAMSKYDEVLESDPGNRNALLARAAINVQNNNAGAAIEDYRKLLLANPKDSLALTSLITVANVAPADAETQLKLMIRDEPDSPYLNFALANAYGAQDRWLEAQSHYFTALENNPGDPNYAYNLAVSLEHIAKPKVAVSYYQRALENMSNGLAMFSKEVVDQRLEMLGKL